MMDHDPTPPDPVASWGPMTHDLSEDRAEGWARLVGGASERAWLQGRVTPFALAHAVNMTLVEAPWGELTNDEQVGPFIHLHQVVESFGLPAVGSLDTVGAIASVRPRGIGDEVKTVVEIAQGGRAVARWSGTYLVPRRGSYVSGGGTDETWRTVGDLDRARRWFSEAAGADYAVVAGDENPIHLDHEAARAAGFDRAIVHGMFTLIVGADLAVVACADGDLARLRLASARFARPVHVATEVDYRFSATDEEGRVAIAASAHGGGVMRRASVLLAPRTSRLVLASDLSGSP